MSIGSLSSRLSGLNSTCIDRFKRGVIAAQDIPDKNKIFLVQNEKEERIESLEPLIESGFLRFNRSHRLLLEQMEQFPGGTHDDLPDALAGAVDIAGGKRRRKKSYYKKPPGL
ncbi:hypothetical protein [Paenibacillus larvae]|uniref:hypothetical protein n=1 Tax=Paenibacillus larvae TaxID=1464 RepID=UPI00288E9A8B|nr:hypothetical protein [Paenibacillus larvae]MDT2268110.1 hypothetical protein [Paenibacillus larvae]